MADPTPPEIVYSSDCPYCRNAVRAISLADVSGSFTFTPIESDRGKELVENHHGEYLHSPHLFTDDLVYFGILPTARGVTRELSPLPLPI